jgi:hypothetical protein
MSQEPAMKRLSTLFVLSLALFFTNLATGQESKVELAELVKAKWEERYGKIKSVEFTLEIKESIEKGFFSSFPGRRLPGITPGAVLPMEDAFHEANRRFVVDGEKLYTEFTGSRYHLGEGWRDVHERESFNGKETRNFHEYKVGETKLQGSIKAGRHLMSCEVVDANPIKCWLGPLWGSQIELNNIKSKDTADDEDAPDEIVETEYGTNMTISFDPTCDYMFAGMDHMRDGKGWALEVVNGIHDNKLWYPMYWKFVQDFNGVKRIHEFRLTNLKINPKVEPNQFEITFPVGTLVGDERKGNRERYIVKPDGSMEPLPSRGRRNAGALN